MYVNHRHNRHRNRRDQEKSGPERGKKDPWNATSQYSCSPIGHHPFTSTLRRPFHKLGRKSATRECILSCGALAHALLGFAFCRNSQERITGDVKRCRQARGGCIYTTIFTTGTGSAKHEVVCLPVWTWVP